MRQAGCVELHHIKLALLETNGHINILTNKDADG
jgi:uncharacterized membrane protein YcaP (DUF421 family)